ncbi:hypothetical protein HPP92_020747 [Vanilla planifolia]|uniref:Uncharacterized protein n=1 Tax=Vanilla planifolia TaxID=51239 RepID=A0A835Q191_VANPL|nr:hypothetical protein HPP92_020747 [Vanilla planifolia]
MATVFGDSELESLISQLHSLKKLYGLLQKRSPTDHLLDEKSRLLLKKLLDDAAHQVLQTQVKVISCSIETPTLQAANPPTSDSCSPQVGLVKPVNEPGVSSSSRRFQVTPDLLSRRRGESVVNRPSLTESRKKSSKPSKFPSERCFPTRSSGSEKGTVGSYSPQVGC